MTEFYNYKKPNYLSEEEYGKLPINDGEIIKKSQTIILLLSGNYEIKDNSDEYENDFLIGNSTYLEYIYSLEIDEAKRLKEISSDLFNKLYHFCMMEYCKRVKNVDYYTDLYKSIPNGLSIMGFTLNRERQKNKYLGTYLLAIANMDKFMATKRECIEELTNSNNVLLNKETAKTTDFER